MSSTLQGSTGKPLPPNAGKGRTKGVPNKITVELKAALLEALDRVGGVSYFESLAKNEPAIFCQLVGKLIPSEIKAEIEGGASNFVINGTWVTTLPGDEIYVNQPGEPPRVITGK